jgi:hypothetical protein
MKRRIEESERRDLPGPKSKLGRQNQRAPATAAAKTEAAEEDVMDMDSTLI